MAVEVRTLRVAAVQMESKDGDIEGNLRRATAFIDEAAGQGARLILLPEFMPTGYLWTDDIWDGGEPSDGPTVSWLKGSSKRLNAWIGTSFLEAVGEDFFNTFVLTGPDGTEAGRVRKQVPAVGEAFFFKGDSGPHVIRTEVGLVGVGICYENALSFFPELMCSQSPDLILMPHSAPSATPSLLVLERAIRKSDENLRGLAAYYAGALGVPVVFSNKSGKWKTKFLPGLAQDSTFPGCSAIADCDGALKAQLGPEEGVIVEEIHLDPARKVRTPPSCRGRWTMKEPRYKYLFILIEAAGRTRYRLSRERRRRARQISSGRT